MENVEIEDRRDTIVRVSFFFFFLFHSIDSN